MAFEDFVDPVTGDILLGNYCIPVDVWNAIYGFVLSVGHVPNPFSAGDSCWAFALYLGIAACESGFRMDAEGDPAADQWSGAAGTCCTYWYCLSDIVCSSDPYQTAWDRARAHATYGAYGAYLSHGVYQLYVCGQGSDYACWPEYLHDMGIHMGIALPHIQNAINIHWDANNIEWSCRICAQASGHPGWVGTYDYRVTNIWNATVNIQPDLCAFLAGNGGPSGIEVMLYEHTYYGGREEVFTSDYPDFGAIGFNDAASSIRINGDIGTLSIRLYEHTYYGGASIEFIADSPNFNNLMMIGSLSWNDQASSIRITQAPGPGPYDPSPLPPIPEIQSMESWPLPALPSSGIGDSSPMPEIPLT